MRKKCLYYRRRNSYYARWQCCSFTVDAYFSLGGRANRDNLHTHIILLEMHMVFRNFRSFLF